MNKKQIISRLKEDPFYIMNVEEQDEEMCLVAKLILESI